MSCTTLLMPREGFWHSEQEPWLPVPAPYVLPWDGRALFLECLRYLEADYRLTRTHHAKGWSTCRMCRRPNGEREYERDGWCWPSGLIHYIEEHAVRPSLAFEEFVLWTCGRLAEARRK